MKKCIGGMKMVGIVYTYDEKTIFEEVILIDGTELRGEFRIVRGHGDLGYAGIVMITDGKRYIPLTAVKYLVRKY